MSNLVAWAILMQLGKYFESCSKRDIALSINSNNTRIKGNMIVCISIPVFGYISDSIDFESLQPYDVADLIKQYFRELPECLLTNKLSETFISVFTRKLIYLLTKVEVHRYLRNNLYSYT